jgi:hypothetical protein
MFVPHGVYLSERALAEKSRDAIPAVDQRASRLRHGSQTTIWSVRVMGIAVHIPAKGRPAADVVVVDGAWGAPVHVTTFKLTSTHEDLPTLLRDLSAGLASRLSGLSVDRVVVRRADKPTRPSNYEGPKTRLLAEGALAACAKATIVDTVLADGRRSVVVARPRRRLGWRLKRRCAWSTNRSTPRRQHCRASSRESGKVGRRARSQ